MGNPLTVGKALYKTVCSQQQGARGPQDQSCFNWLWDYLKIINNVSVDTTVEEWNQDMNTKYAAQPQVLAQDSRGCSLQR